MRVSAKYMDSFDFSTPAELYTTGKRRIGQNSMTYRRFETAAEAIRFTIEELSAARQNGAVLEVNEDRFRHTEIRKFYDSSSYPLRRRAGKGEDAT